MNKNKDAIDIVIPVYNGYEDIQLCMDSIRRHTDLGKHRVLLINDCSPDERIRPWLDAQAGENVVVLHNEKNQGFSANVNKGMLYSDRDVILLNSDTIVTKGWVEKIQACAYLSRRNATVTPLSNSATLCSVPVFCRDNPVPENVTVDEYAALIERCSLRRYPRITVAVGFCMYIKRQVIEEVGLFDAETFGRGYGEENDFCNRCEQMGYRHVMCDDTFIYHKGTASFDTAEKQALCDAHNAILEERYPVQMRKNHLYCMENPDQEIRDNIEMYRKLFNGHKNILYLLHLDFQTDAFNNIGGTQLHVRDLMTALRKEYNVFVAARDLDCLRVTAYTETEEISLKFHIGEPEDFPVFYDETLAKVFEEVLRAFSIDLVHVHHTQDLSLDIYETAAGLDIPIVATLHDYYYACPTVKLLNGEGKFCPNQGEKDCVECLRQTCGFAAQISYMEKWQRENERALNLCERIIFPSESAKSVVTAIFPSLMGKSLVISHGSDLVKNEKSSLVLHGEIEKSKRVKTHLDQVPGTKRGFNYVTGWAYFDSADNKEVKLYLEVADASGRVFTVPLQKKARPDVVNSTGQPGVLWCGIHTVFSIPDMAEGKCKLRLVLEHRGCYFTDGKVYGGNYRAEQGEPGRMNVAFIGGMVPAKGSRLVYELLQKETAEINWFIMGAIGDDCLNRLEERPYTYFSNVYEKDDIFELLKSSKIDVICIMPTWAETFCYTVSEAWLCGIPVVGADIGAVGERIRETGAGWTVDVNTKPEELLKLLHHIRKHPEELEEKRKNVKKLRIKPIGEMCREYEEFYRGILERHPVVHTDEGIDFDFIFQGLALANPHVRGKGNVASLNMLREENKRLTASMEMLKGTTSYKIARKISDADIPFKETLKKIIKR